MEHRPKMYLGMLSPHAMHLRDLLLFLALPTQLCAQITIGPDDMPSVGDTLRYHSTLPAAIDLDGTGPGHVWDFSQLEPLSEGADTAVTVGSTPFAYQFIFNNGILYPNHQADYAMKGPSFGIEGFSLQNVYEYYKKGSTGFRNVGFGATINGIPTSVRRIPVDVIYPFPLNYGDTDANNSAFQVNIPTILFFGQDQLRTSQVDGWGTLVLPTASFEVLRVRSVLERRDTIHIEALGQGFGFDEPETVEYKWLAQGMGAPVMQVTTVAGIPTEVRFFHDPDFNTGIAAPSLPELVAYPNPAADAFWLHIPPGAHGQLELLDAAGRVVVAHAARGGERLQVGLAGLASGHYVLRLQGEGFRYHGRVVVQQ